MGTVKYFYSYVRAVKELGISRRTLQRWIDAMEITPLEFEDQARVMLILPHIERLREYSKVLRTKDSVLISRYKDAVKTGNEQMLMRLRKQLKLVTETPKE